MALTFEHLEALTLAEDREPGLAKLIPGTPDYYFHRALAHQLAGELDEAAKRLEAWRKRSGTSDPRLQQLETRQLLLSYEQDSGRVRDELRQRLGLRFDHQREQAAAERELASRVDPELISRAGFLRALAHKPARERIAQFTDAALPYLCELDDLDDQQVGALLRRMKRPDYPRAVQLIARELATRESRGFGSITVHGLLTDVQLDELLAARPGLRNDPGFIDARLARLAPGPEVDLRRDVGAMRAYLERLWAFVERLPSAFNELKVHVLYHWLDFDRRQGVLERERLETYLKLPRDSPVVASDYRKRNKSQLASFGQSFKTGLEIIHGDGELLKALMLELFGQAQAPSYAVFEAYLDSRWLKRVYAEAKILSGQEGDREAWFSLLDDASYYQQLERRVDLELAIDNPRSLGADEAVELGVYVKNIDALVIKVFELDVEAYFLAHGKPVSADIDLDGLVAVNERSLEIARPPLVRARHQLKFPELTRAGTFVIELIGGGRSSRALLRKGELNYLDRLSSAGHALTVIDETGTARPEATLLLGTQVYAADEGGELRVPFHAGSSSSSRGLLRCGGRVSVVELRTASEAYTLDASFHVAREQLIAGAEAELVIRASLRVAGAAVSPSLFEELKLTLTANTRKDHETSLERPIELDEAAEATYRFKVPDHLESLHFELRGKLRQLSAQRDVELSTSGRLSVNQIDKSTATAALHLAHSAGGYQLWALGKTGEARAGLQVNLSVAHREFVPRIKMELRTDARGCVELGELADITNVQASLAGTPGTRAWTLPRARQSLPARLHIAAGEALSLPRAHDEQAPLRSLLERRGGVVRRDWMGAVRLSPGQLHIEGLEPGDYQLIFADGHGLELRVGGSKRVPGWAVSPARRLELRAANIPAIVAVEADSGAGVLRVRLAGHDERTRVHVFASAFLPPRTAYDALVQRRRRAPVSQPSAFVPNVYLSGRDIGEEYRYILERRRAQRFAGTMLERPSLLLNPWELRKTSSTKREAAVGGNYDAMRSEMAPAAARPPAAPAPKQVAVSPGVNLDFLPRPGLARCNLEVDEQGVVELPLSELENLRFVEILAANELAMSSAHHALPAVEPAPKDLRLRRGFDPDAHIIKRKRFEGIAVDEELVLEDRRTAQFELVDSVTKAHGLLATLSNDATLRKFEFITRWPSLAPERQRELYGKYACHELNLFLARKDPEFFAALVRPYLANKRERTFMDDYLLGEPLEGYLEPWAYGRLNTMERCLLAGRVQADAGACKRQLEDKVELQPPDPSGDDDLFDTVLQGSALEVAAGGTMDSMDLARFEEEADDDLFLDEEGSIGSSRGMGFGGGGPPAPGAPPPPAPRSAARKRKASKGGRGGRGRRDMMARERSAPRYRPGDKTSEWAETHYYQLRRKQQGPELIEANAFWRDYATHLASDERAGQPFLSGNFVRAKGNFAEMMGALALLDLPFEAQAPEPSLEGTRARLKASSPLIAFHAQLSPVELGSQARDELLVAQDYFRADDRHEWVNGRQLEKYVKGEFLVHTVYCCRVTVTNTGSSDQQLNLLLQIPRGALPVDDGYETDDLSIHLSSRDIATVEYAFYFPAPGSFAHYPVHVSSEGELAAYATPRTLEVVRELSEVDTNSWSHVSQQGSTEDLLAFLERNNVERLDLTRMAWRMRERSAYEAVLAHLRARHRYSEVLWGYAVHHDDRQAMGELLRHQSALLQQCGQALHSPLVSFSADRRGWYEHLEYAPLVHARAHVLGARREIQNEALAGQYRSFLEQLLYVAKPSADQLLSAVYYMLVQDRVADAIALLGRIELQGERAMLQHDYLRAYIALLQGEVDEAERRARPHAEHGVDRWRKRFAAVIDMLEELRGADPSIVDADSREQVQAHHAAHTPSLELELHGDSLRLGYRSLERCTVNYYRMDLELLFSRQPFMRDQSKRFSMVQPNLSEELSLPPEGSEVEHPLPEELRRANALIEVVGGGLRRSKTSFAHDLQLRVSESYGQLRVYARGDQSPLPRTYIKVYARQRNGKVAFYKDGYTDLRGAFDYATVSTAYEGEQAVERFSILILSESHGALVREVEGVG